jgi:hypothetical protein
MVNSRALAFAALVVLVVVAGGIGAWLHFHKEAEPENVQDADQDEPPSIGLSDAELQYLPDSKSEIVVYQLDRVRSCPAYAEFQKCEGARLHLGLWLAPKALRIN